MKLSEITYKDLILNWNQENLEKIVFELNRPNVSKRCNIGFVPSLLPMIPNGVNEAIDLYKNGLIRKILLSGGIAPLSLDRRTPESIKMKKILLKSGIPIQDIIIENNSHNMKESIDYSLTILKNGCFNIEQTSFALIADELYLKRIFLMLAQALERTEDIYVHKVPNKKTDLANWNNSFQGQSLVFYEAFKLRTYAQKGWAKDSDIPTLKLTKKK